MGEVTFEAIENLVGEVKSKDKKLSVTFECPKTSRKVEASVEIEQSLLEAVEQGAVDMAFKGAKKAVDKEKKAAKKGIIGWIVGLLGGGAAGKMGGKLAGKALSGAEKAGDKKVDAAKAEKLTIGRNKAIVSAFESVKDQFEESDGTWVGKPEEEKKDEEKKE